jgi:hypothetical protein
MADVEQSNTVKSKKKFYKQPVFWVGAVILVIIISATSDGSDKNKTLTVSDSAAKTSATADTAKHQQSNDKPSSTAQTAPATTAPTTTKPAAPAETVSQKNAVNKAKDYLSYTAFSHDGLIEQLEYEKFSTADATYGADHSGADWMEQAAKKAKDYMSYSSFSRGSLIEQLEYDKFTPEQAAHGADSVGL